MNDLRKKENNSTFMLKGSNSSSLILKNEVKVADMRSQQKSTKESNNK